MINHATVLADALAKAIEADLPWTDETLSMDEIRAIADLCANKSVSYYDAHHAEAAYEACPDEAVCAELEGQPTRKPNLGEE